MLLSEVLEQLKAYGLPLVLEQETNRYCSDGRILVVLNSHPESADHVTELKFFGVLQGPFTEAIQTALINCHWGGAMPLVGERLFVMALAANGHQGVPVLQQQLQLIQQLHPLPLSQFPPEQLYFHGYNTASVTERFTIPASLIS